MVGVCFSVPSFDLDLNKEFSCIENIDIDILKLADGFVAKQTGDILNNDEITMLSTYIEKFWSKLTEGTLLRDNEYMLNKTYYYICAYMLIKSTNESKISDLITLYYNFYTLRRNLTCVYIHINLLMDLINSMIDLNILNIYDLNNLCAFFDSFDTRLCNPTRKSFDELKKELLSNRRTANLSTYKREDIIKARNVSNRINDTAMCSLADINTLSEIWMECDKKLSSKYQLTNHFLDCIDVCILRLYSEIYARTVAIRFNLLLPSTNANDATIDAIISRCTNTFLEIKRDECPKKTLPCILLQIFPNTIRHQYIFPLRLM